MIDVDLDADAVFAALIDRADALRQALEARIKANLSGEVLHARSGALLGSIDSSLEEDGGHVIVSAESAGVPYAGILEYGGKTAAHDIVATKAKALAFITDGARHFAKIVHHPGSQIRAFSYMSGALDDLDDDIEAGLKDAVLTALGAG